MAATGTDTGTGENDATGTPLVIWSESLNIVCRLGGFHTLMSYLGSWVVSGLVEVL